MLNWTMYLSYGTHVGCVVIDHLTGASYFKYFFFFFGLVTQAPSLEYRNLMNR
jgi:hypothetical protein